MSTGPKKTPTQELENIGGPVHLIASYQMKLTARLSALLERRRVIKGHLGSTDIEAESEIDRICSSFANDIRADLRQLILEAYGYRRFVKMMPFDTWEDIPEMEIVLKDTIPYGMTYTPTANPDPEIRPEIKSKETAFDDFSDLFDKRK